MVGKRDLARALVHPINVPAIGGTSFEALRQFLLTKILQGHVASPPAAIRIPGFKITGTRQSKQAA